MRRVRGSRIYLTNGNVSLPCRNAGGTGGVDSERVTPRTALAVRGTLCFLAASPDGGGIWRARTARRSCSVWDGVSKRCRGSKGRALWRLRYNIGEATRRNKRGRCPNAGLRHRPTYPLSHTCTPKQGETPLWESRAGAPDRDAAAAAAVCAWRRVHGQREDGASGAILGLSRRGFLTTVQARCKGEGCGRVVDTAEAVGVSAGVGVWEYVWVRV